MKLNRYLCIGFIIASGIFASFFGGNISYALFYLSILIPIVAFSYTLYVYRSFKLHQSLDRNMMVKGDWIAYSFVIANESWFTFRYIKCIFLKDRSTLEETENVTHYSLLPNDRERLDTRLRCNYRGEYHVGVEAIEVSDFFNLFTIRYPLESKLKAVVLPRVVVLDHIVVAPALEDMKNPKFFSDFVEEELDQEIRKYVPGDHRKRIHWKASARQGELVSRKYLSKPKTNITIFIDLHKLKGNELERIIMEDKMIESSLAIVNYYATREISSNVICEKGGLQNYSIRNKREFDVFYHTCAQLNFNGNVPLNMVIEEALKKGYLGNFSVVVTHKLSMELYETISKIISLGLNLSIIWISDDVMEETNELRESLFQIGVVVYHIMIKDDIEPILTRSS